MSPVRHSSPTGGGGAESAPSCYVATELGFIPQDWRASDIDSLNPFVTSGARGWASFYSDTGSPFIRITNLARQSIDLDLSDLKFVSLPRHAYVEATRTALRDGDLLISVTADVGIIGFVDPRTPKPAYINQHLALMRFDQTLVCPRFIAYALASGGPQRLFRAAVDMGAKAGMNLQTVRKIRLSLPTRAEQHVVADALSDVDALIRTLNDLIAKKQAIKQAVMQQLLTGRTRFPNFHGKWEVKRLGDVVKITKGQLITEEDAISGSIPVIAGGKKPAYFHNKPNRTGKTVTISASGASAGYVAFFNGPIFASDCSTISEASEYSIEFIYFQLQLKQATIYKAQVGGAQPHIHAVDINPLEVFWPGPPEQTAIAQVLTDMDAELAALEQRREKISDLQQGMTQQLLTGRTRLVKPHPSITHPNKESKKHIKHSWAFNEAIVISALTKQFGSEPFPLGRKRYTKLSYLLHRHVEKRADGYLKKAAGPYNPKTKYGGPERIAVESEYIREHKNGPYRGFIPADSIAQATGYFERWYGQDSIKWLEQFRYNTNDDLEVLTTVDTAAEELRVTGKKVDVAAVKNVLNMHPEWQAKLHRQVFSDSNIATAVRMIHELFDSNSRPAP